MDNFSKEFVDGEIKYLEDLERGYEFRRDKNKMNKNKTGRKIYVVGGSDNYANWMEGELVDKLEDANLVVFTGGEDVDPYFYGKKRNPTTYSDIGRDKYEIEYFHNAKLLGIKMIGICRGSQFLCVMNHGLLVQNQCNPSYLHPMKTEDEQIITVSSTHHQAQFPFELNKNDYRIIGWTENLCQYHEGENSKQELNPPKECEIVYYPKNKCLGIQSHPEYSEILHNNKSISYFKDLLNRFMEDKL
jgi:gamma-glutamyl-gamma-aminobutyrate hydrolase PuuD